MPTINSTAVRDRVGSKSPSGKCIVERPHYCIHKCNSVGVWRLCFPESPGQAEGGASDVDGVHGTGGTLLLAARHTPYTLNLLFFCC
ncbi:unnamed protein product [Victoria cruziana]